MQTICAVGPGPIEPRPIGLRPIGPGPRPKGLVLALLPLGLVLAQWAWSRTSCPLGLSQIVSLGPTAGARTITWLLLGNY